MKYIVKNCPSCRYTPKRYIDGIDYICWNAQNFNSSARGLCQDCTDYAIKQVIEECNIYKNFIAITISDYAKRELALHILDLFDIARVRE